MRTTLSSPPSRDFPAMPGIEDEDVHLVALAKGDPRAFAPLYRRYFDPVYRYCYRRLGSPEAAADATAHVFAKALAALPRYREESSSFRSWLFTIAHNVIVDDLRSRRPTSSLETAAHVAARDPSPEDVALSEEAGRTVRALLAALPPDQRQILELRLAGLTGPEIAAVLGRTLGAVKIAQVRAFARLRATFDPSGARSMEVASDES
ncbi:MAG: sigma-70 family RNA polymerase sigma factor [Thermomicrobiales bacterium]